MRLAQATGVRLEWLATGEGPMRPDAPPPLADAPADAPALERRIAELLRAGGLEVELRPHGADQGIDLVVAGLPLQVKSTPAEPPRLFSLIDADRLGAAYAAARQAFAVRGQTDVEPRRIMQVTVLIYDSLGEVEPGQTTVGKDPQDDPQKHPPEIVEGRSTSR